MKEYVNEHTFRDRFMRSDNYKHNFSDEGLHALFEYIEQVEDDIGEEFEFDMVGICCDYTEYDNLDDFAEDYVHAWSNGRRFSGNQLLHETTLDAVRETATITRNNK